MEGLREVSDEEDKGVFGVVLYLENHQLTPWAVRRRVPLQEV